ncbi:hypothetical protein JOC77_003173 [Peribacillus deserti]|uniref:DUF3231 family protein n=1 Tax=Peribacillus deserti TaxID=673318 RepID=A0ABS2QKN8_9BACI|nr:DUF3231 family protein [Peribacillus deserti]MBM7693729.1 hypothetical protein [Peribacillus deserti]
MEIEHNPRLTSSEIAYLWGVKLGDSMHICIFKYFLEHVEDTNIKALIKHALDLSQQHVETIQNICTEEGIVLPIFFTEDDMNLKAKRLFSDTFYLHYIKNMAKGGLVTHGWALGNLYRLDIRSYGSKSIASSVELDNEVSRILLEKGLAARPPYIPYQQEVDVIRKHSFIYEWLGKKRALAATEITDLYNNIAANELGIAIATAFGRIARSEKVRDYIQRGKDLSLKQVRIYGEYLENHSLTIPTLIGLEVTDSTESPFSDKLLMIHFSLMNHSSVGNLGMSISESLRSDLIVDYSRISSEVLKYAEDGMNLLIENKWMEKPPTASTDEDIG